MRRLVAIALIGAASGCRPGAGAAVSGGPVGKRAPQDPKYPARIHAKHTPATVTRPGKPLSLAEAQRYFLQLVNRDREAEGLEPVAWDPIAEKAGHEHAADMAE